MPSNPEPPRIAFLGYGFIAGVQSQHLRALRREFAPSYASRDGSNSAEHTGQ